MVIPIVIGAPLVLSGLGLAYRYCMAPRSRPTQDEKSNADKNLQASSVSTTPISPVSVTAIAINDPTPPTKSASAETTLALLNPISAPAKVVYKAAMALVTNGTTPTPTDKEVDQAAKTAILGTGLYAAASALAPYLPVSLTGAASSTVTYLSMGLSGALYIVGIPVTGFLVYRAWQNRNSPEGPKLALVAAVSAGATVYSGIKLAQSLGKLLDHDSAVPSDDPSHSASSHPTPPSTPAIGRHGPQLMAFSDCPADLTPSCTTITCIPSDPRVDVRNLGAISGNIPWKLATPTSLSAFVSNSTTEYAARCGLSSACVDSYRPDGVQGLNHLLYLGRNSLSGSVGPCTQTVFDGLVSPAYRDLVRLDSSNQVYYPNATCVANTLLDAAISYAGGQVGVNSTGMHRFGSNLVYGLSWYDSYVPDITQASKTLQTLGLQTYSNTTHGLFLRSSQYPIALGLSSYNPAVSGTYSLASQGVYNNATHYPISVGLSSYNASQNALVLYGYQGFNPAVSGTYSLASQGVYNNATHYPISVGLSSYNASQYVPVLLNSSYNCQTPSASTLPGDAQVVSYMDFRFLNHSSSEMLNVTSGNTSYAFGLSDRYVPPSDAIVRGLDASPNRTTITFNSMTNLTSSNSDRPTFVRLSNDWFCGWNGTGAWPSFSLTSGQPFLPSSLNCSNVTSNPTSYPQPTPSDAAAQLLATNPSASNGSSISGLTFVGTSNLPIFVDAQVAIRESLFGNNNGTVFGNIRAFSPSRLANYVESHKVCTPPALPVTECPPLVSGTYGQVEEYGRREFGEDYNRLGARSFNRGRYVLMTDTAVVALLISFAGIGVPATLFICCCHNHRNGDGCVVRPRTNFATKLIMDAAPKLADPQGSLFVLEEHSNNGGGFTQAQAKAAEKVLDEYLELKKKVTDEDAKKNSGCCGPRPRITVNAAFTTGLAAITDPNGAIPALRAHAGGGGGFTQVNAQHAVTIFAAYKKDLHEKLGVAALNGTDHLT